MKNIEHISNNINLGEEKIDQAVNIGKSFSLSDIGIIFRASFVFFNKDIVNFDEDYTKIHFAEDLNYIDLLEICLILSEKLGLNNSSKINKILFKTKILSAKILRNNSVDNPEIMNFTKYFKIKTLKLIKNQNLDFGNTKKNLKENNNSIEEIFNKIISEIYELYLEIMMEKGLIDMNKNQTTFTKSDLFTSNFKYGNINKNTEIELDIKKQKLREKINIDLLKREIKKNNNDDVSQIKATKKILEVIREFPYNNNSQNGGLTRNIIETNETYCTGYAIMGHNFLNELGIKHQIITTYNHISIIVEIGNKKYIFDPVSSNKLVEIGIIESNIKNYKKYFLKSQSNGYNDFIEKELDFKEFENNKSIIISMLITISAQYYEENNFKKSLEYNNLAINFDFENINLLNYRKIFLEKLGKKEISKLYEFLIEEIKSENKIIGIKNRKIKKVLKKIVNENKIKEAIQILFEKENNYSLTKKL